MENLFAPKTEVFKIDPEDPDIKAIERAAEVIRSGGIVVYPTDTLYGFGVDIKNPFAMDRLYGLKGRDQNKPVSLLINALEQAENIIGQLNDSEKNVFKKLFPGKSTLIFRIRKKITYQRLSQLKKIGFRIPESKICRLLIEKTGDAITSTSVNISNQKNLKTVDEILHSFKSQIDLVLDAGPLDKSEGSTILDCTTMPPTILRSGDLTAKKIALALGYQPYSSYPKKFTVTFVCSGNICRSPMAEGILRKMISRTKYKSVIQVNSAGTLNINGSSPTIEAIDVADIMSVNIGQHKSQGLNMDIISHASLVICMALDHYNYIVKTYPAFKSKVLLLKQWGVKDRLGNPSIADPIGRALSYYERIFGEISREIHRIFPEIIRMVNEFLADTQQNLELNETKENLAD